MKSVATSSSSKVEKSETPANPISVEKAFSAVEQRRDEITKVLQDLIKIPTVVPPGNNYENMVRYLEPYLHQLGFETERVIVPEEYIQQIPHPLEGPRINLVATRDYGQDEWVTIYAHMDVVPIEEPWTKEPFVGIAEDGKIFGRGAFDMKSGIAATLIAIQVIDELGLTPQFNLNCIFCTDEEVGVYPGSYHLAKEGYVKGHVINTEMGSQMPLIFAGTAGTVDVRITTKGRSCHSGMNFLGVNAVEAMVPILQELLELKQEVEQRESTVPLVPLFRSFGAPSDMMTPMFNLDVIHGGNKSNIVPATCELIINRRYIPEESYEAVVEEIEAAIERGKVKSKALDVQVEFTHIYPPFKANTNSIYTQRLCESLKAVQGFQDSDFVYGGAAASTDMGFVAQALKTDKIIGMGPVKFDNLSAHKPDEWVRIDDLLDMTKQLVYYLSF